MDGDYAVFGAYGTGSGVGAAYVFQRSSGVWAQVQKVVPDGSSSSFGRAVSISGTTFVAYGSGDDSKPGAVHIYGRTQGSWTLNQTLFSQTPQPQGYFGWAVSLDKNTLVVGAPNEDANSITYAGNVYVYERPDESSLFVLKKTLSGSVPNGVNGEFFGSSVAVQGDILAVGSSKSNRTGAVYAQQHRVLPVLGRVAGP